MYTDWFATALFAGKAAQIAAMAIVTLALAAFGKMALSLRKSIVGTLNDASQNIIDKFVLPKEGASFTGSTSMSGGGQSSGKLSHMASGASHTVNSAANTMNSLNRAGVLLAGGGAVAGGGGLLAGKFLGGKRAEVGTGSGEAGISDTNQTSTTSSISASATQASSDRSSDATTSDTVNAVMAGTSAVSNQSNIDANADQMNIRGDAGRMDMKAREYGKELLAQDSLEKSGSSSSMASRSNELRTNSSSKEVHAQDGFTEKMSMLDRSNQNAKPDGEDIQIPVASGASKVGMKVGMTRETNRPMATTDGQSMVSSMASSMTDTTDTKADTKTFVSPFDSRTGVSDNRMAKGTGVNQGVRALEPSASGQIHKSNQSNQSNQNNEGQRSKMLRFENQRSGVISDDPMDASMVRGVAYAQPASMKGNAGLSNQTQKNLSMDDASGYALKQQGGVVKDSSTSANEMSRNHFVSSDKQSSLKKGLSASTASHHATTSLDEAKHFDTGAASIQGQTTHNGAKATSAFDTKNVAKDFRQNGTNRSDFASMQKDSMQQNLAKSGTTTHTNGVSANMATNAMDVKSGASVNKVTSNRLVNGAASSQTSPTAKNLTDTRAVRATGASKISESNANASVSDDKKKMTARDRHSTSDQSSIRSRVQANSVASHPQSFAPDQTQTMGTNKALATKNAKVGVSIGATGSAMASVNGVVGDSGILQGAEKMVNGRVASNSHSLNKMSTNGSSGSSTVDDQMRAHEASRSIFNGRSSMSTSASAPSNVNDRDQKMPTGAASIRSQVGAKIGSSTILNPTDTKNVAKDFRQGGTNRSDFTSMQKDSMQKDSAKVATSATTNRATADTMNHVRSSTSTMTNEGASNRSVNGVSSQPNARQNHVSDSFANSAKNRGVNGSSGVSQAEKAFAMRSEGNGKDRGSSSHPTSSSYRQSTDANGLHGSRAVFNASTPSSKETQSTMTDASHSNQSKTKTGTASSNENYRNGDYRGLNLNSGNVQSTPTSVNHHFDGASSKRSSENSRVMTSMTGNVNGMGMGREVRTSDRMSSTASINSKMGGNQDLHRTSSHLSGASASSFASGALSRSGMEKTGGFGFSGTTHSHTATRTSTVDKTHSSDQNQTTNRSTSGLSYSMPSSSPASSLPHGQGGASHVLVSGAHGQTPSSAPTNVHLTQQTKPEHKKDKKEKSNDQRSTPHLTSTSAPSDSTNPKVKEVGAKSSAKKEDNSVGASGRTMKERGQTDSSNYRNHSEK